MSIKRSKTDERLRRFSDLYDLNIGVLREYQKLFADNGIYTATGKIKRRGCAKNIVMISTHGYWGDPPPAGVPDTGGQTYYVLETSKAWARQGRRVIIIARWFKPFPRVEKFNENVWLIRIKAGGDKFIRKEDIYPLVPEMAEAQTAISALFGADAVVGHYADGMAGAIEVGERLKIPALTVPHSIGARKLKNIGKDLFDPEAWFDPQYNFWIRESYEILSLMGSNFEIANTPAEPSILKSYYNLEFPHAVMPAGAGKDYFKAYRNVREGASNTIKRFGLEPKKYFIFFGRFSEAKNIPGAVAVFGEARRINPKLFRDKKFLIVGGEIENPQGEEAAVADKIEEMKSRYDLTKDDVVRIPSQNWPELSELAAGSVCYIGMQMMEPFGMAAAEAMAAGAPVMISRAAGITRWLKNGEHALIVDPKDPVSAAKLLSEKMRYKKSMEKISRAGRKLAKEQFSWEGIAKNIGRILDSLHKGDAPATMNGQDCPRKTLNKREGRAFHRMAYAWRGDPPILKMRHKKASAALRPHIIKAAKKEGKRGRRLVVALGGESGAGKSEIAVYLKYLLRRDGLRSMIIPGDAFFKLSPAKNHEAREKAFAEGRLKERLGPPEIDLERLDKIALQASDRRKKLVHIPSSCRRLHSRRYEEVPVCLKNYDIVFVDLTCSLLLRNASLKIFLEADFTKRLKEMKERHSKRDPDQPFDFIKKVLEIEHQIFQGLRKEADIVIDKDYNLSSLRKGPPKKDAK